MAAAAAAAQHNAPPTASPSPSIMDARTHLNELRTPTADGTLSRARVRALPAFSIAARTLERGMTSSGNILGSLPSTPTMTALLLLVAAAHSRLTGEAFRAPSYDPAGLHLKFHGWSKPTPG